MIDNDEACKTWNALVNVAKQPLVKAIDMEAYFEQFRGDTSPGFLVEGCTDPEGHLWDYYKDMTTLSEFDSFWRCRRCGEIRTTLYA